MLGLCSGRSDQVVDPAMRKSNWAIDRTIMNEMNDAARKKGLLLLGAGESGKSTIFKQVKLITSSGYSQDELHHFRYIIHRNALDGIKILLEEAEKRSLELSEDNEELADRIQLWAGENLNPELGSSIAKVWRDPSVQATFKLRAEFQLGDSAAYFLNDVERLSATDFLPTTDDVLRARVRTSGVVMKDFSFKKQEFRLFDVGGQRSERRRWLQYFDHVTSIVFVAAISEYNQVMAEDSSKNRLEEALELFEQIVNSHYFKDVDIMVFLNKRDLFADKIKEIDPIKWFPDYKGGCNYDAAETYFKNAFRARVKDKKKELYLYSTCATDTGNIKFVLDAISTMWMDKAQGAIIG
ncbi:hypothetical protein AB1Y20_003966 [Prymnesium parvum]|uniref:Uncharacterized protein n=1 Tax=Prymnesium parvum TaxID=97485 RepID=A0AB34J8I8_PRYPA